MAEELLSIIKDVSLMVDKFPNDPFRKSSVWLSRKISLLLHLIEEIREFVSRGISSSSSSSLNDASCLDNLLLGLQAAKRFLQHDNALERSIAVQFCYVTWQLEKVLGELPYDDFEISDEVQEQVELVRVQLKRATEKSGIPDLKIFEEIYKIMTHKQVKELTRESSSRKLKELQIEETSTVNHIDHDYDGIVLLIAEVNGKSKREAEKITMKLKDMIGKIADNGDEKNIKNVKKVKEVKRSDSLAIPEDFRCPISLELMRDPVIVSTGQTYERAFIQRWVDCGNRTCPKTQQKLQNITLTPNYVLRSLIMQWCEINNIDQPRKSLTRRIRKGDGSFQDITGDRDTINLLVHNLLNGSLEEKRSSAAEIRSLAKRSTDNRIIIAEAGAITALVSLLSSDDLKTQEHAVTSILNLSIYDHNKELIVLAGAIFPIVSVLKKGSMEARENAAAAIFSLSLIDENKITIGSTPGAIDALVDLLNSGSQRGKKDAATALFNLCIYQGNKLRALRIGILKPLLQMLGDSASSGMVDEALTILSVLVSHQEGKIAMVKANTIPVLIDLLRTGQPRNKENATAILLALCKKDGENLACIGRLGAVVPLTEISKSGTDRAKRKATSLLEHLFKLQVF